MYKGFTLIVLIILVVLAIFIIIELNRSEFQKPHQITYEDGTYRGVFIDGEVIQVNVEFSLKDGIVTDASFRHLKRNEIYYMGTEQEPYRSVCMQYQEALQYLVGKDLKTHLADLYRPGEIVTLEVDGYTSATIRSSKIISAIRDGLNRGVYSY